MADKDSAEYRAKGKVHDMRRTQKAVAGAAEKKRKKTVRSKVGSALEKASVTETGKKVARKIGGNPEPGKKRSSGKRGTGGNFGPSMSIPPAGGSTERNHGQGYDTITAPLKEKK